MESSESNMPTVAIVGRPNVGKSSLFNRIIDRRHAIVANEEGTTRDRLVSVVDRYEKKFLLVDTGGLDLGSTDTLVTKVKEQAGMAISGADVVLFVVDCDSGLTPTDQLIAEQLRTAGINIILVINKVDNDGRRNNIAEFFSMGFWNYVCVSAHHNIGMDDLYSLVSELLPHEPDASVSNTEDESIKIAIVGRPNVGKSALVNAVLGEERTIVSPIAGTTRDAIDSDLMFEDRQLTLIDTAGIRRPGKVGVGIEKFSVLRAMSAVERSDVVVMVADASLLATSQDIHVAGLAWEMCKGIIVVVNKWDLVNNPTEHAQMRAMNRVRDRMHFMNYIPVCFTSALYGEGIDGLLATVLDLYEERNIRVDNTKLQYALYNALANHMPKAPKTKSRRGIKIRKMSQVGVNPPTFTVSVNNPELLHFTYKRYLENQIRQEFGFNRTHLRLIYKKA
ncbi:MAG: ribosome biogenesis GTPase Der [SAR202 cluster bacterium]|nr:ribosome biogenesis GTPase Der [SAR202 cluster bacterium]